MRRVAVALLALALVLPAPAAGWTTAEFTSPDMDVVFTSSKDLKYVDANGNVGDTGAQAIRPGGVADFDDDGQPEIAFQDRNDGYLKYVDAAGSVTNLSISVGGIGGAGDFDNDGDPEVLYSDGGDNLKYADAGGTTTDIGVQTADIGGFGDFDGDGAIEIAHQDDVFDKNLMVTEPDGTSTDTGLQASSAGAIKDVDGDGDAELLFIDTNNNVKIVESGGSPTDLGIDSLSVGDAADIDDDGDVEMAVRRASDDRLVLVESDGSIEETVGTGLGRAGPIADVDLDGVYTGSPSIDDGSVIPDGAQVSSTPVTLSVNVSDAEFASGDEVNATVYLNGNVVGSETLTANGTVSVQTSAAMAGENTWWVVAEDIAGNSQRSANFTFATPSVLEIRNETAPSNLINNAGNITITYYGGDQVVQRQVSDGTANLSGLPAGAELVAVVQADGYVTRRIVIGSLFEQQRVYLLNQSASSVEVQFELTDPTGEFPPEETTLYIQKPIGVNGNTTYQTIAADSFGATGAFTATLADDERYRLRVVSDGNERVLGSYTATVSTVEELQIQRLEPRADDRDNGVVYGAVEQTQSGSQLAVRFRGGEPNSTVEYTVTNETGATIVPTTTTEASSFAHLYPLNATNESRTLNVSWTVTNPDGTTTSGSFTAGDAASIAHRFDMDAQVLSIASWFLILATMGLIVIVDAKLAPAAGTGVATALVTVGTVAIPMPILGVAGAVSVLSLFGGRG